MANDDQSCVKASTASALKESGIKPRQLSILITSKSVNRMRTPELIELSKDFIVKRNSRQNQLSCWLKKKSALAFCCRGNQKYPVESAAGRRKKITFKAMSCRSWTILPSWIILTTFWLSVYKRTLWRIKWFSKDWRANWIPTSFLQVEDLRDSSTDQFRGQTRLESWIRAAQPAKEASENKTLDETNRTGQNSLKGHN